MTDKERIAALELKIVELENVLRGMQQQLDALKRMEVVGGNVIHTGQNILITR